MAWTVHRWGSEGGAARQPATGSALRTFSGAKCTGSVHFTHENGRVPPNRRDDPSQCIFRSTADVVSLHFDPSPPTGARFHVISPPASQPSIEPWIRVYRTALIFDDEIVHRHDGIRVTSPPLTVVNLTRYLPINALASAIESALHNELCTEATLFRVAERRNTPGRPWVRRFLRVLAGRAPGRARESDWERRVFDALVKRGVVGLEGQVKGTFPGYGNVRFDMAIPSIQWVLEVDVHPEHRTVEGQTGDYRRDRRTRRSGWFVDRVGEAELTIEFDATLDDVVASVELRRQEVARLAAAGLWPLR
jgi:very-short-patch-repair endonuclease